MSSQVRGPGGPVVVLTTAVVVFVLGFSVSTQGPERGNRITRINGAEAVENEVLLKYRDGSQRANQRAVEGAVDSETVEALDRRGMRRLRSRRFRTEDLLAMLSSDPDIEYVEPNYVVRLALTPNDPSFTSLWGLFNDGLNPVGGGGVPGADIDVLDAWDTTTGSRANVIAVLDTGIDYTHPDLAANMWSAPSTFGVTVGGVMIFCAGGSHGFNAITRSCDPIDDHFHGTHAAGTIGARGNNGAGVSGVNWTTSMMGVKILGSSGSGTVADAVAGLEFVVQAKAFFASTRGANVRVLSNSWASSGYSVSLLNAINAADASDMLFVAAAGNNSSNNDVTPVYPASYPAANLVAVASSASADQRSWFSNYGATSVHLAAPGSAILSTVPGNAYAIANGTSMATPHVSGTAVLALSMCEVSTPELKSLLLDHVTLKPAFSGTTISGGRLDAAATVGNCPYPKPMSLAVTSSLVSPQPVDTTVTWRAVTTGGWSNQFRWLVWEGGTWVLKQSWSLNSQFSWRPRTADASYQVLAQVRSAWNEGAAEYSVATPFAIMSPVTSATLTANLTGWQPLGTTVTWTASAVGGEAPYEYQFLVHNGVSWGVARSWNASNTFAWTPTVASVSYKVMVQVRSAWNPGSSEVNVAKSFIIRDSVSSATLTADKTSPRWPTTTITWTASAAAGGEAPYQYQFAVWDGVAWTVTRPWSTSAVYIWTPMVANSDYQVQVQVRSHWNGGAAEYSTARAFPITTPPPVTNVTLTPDVAAPRALGTTTTFTAAASGGTAPYQYQWSVYDGAWSVARAWSSNNVFAWTPTVANSAYRVKVEARSAWNTWGAERETEMSYYVGAGVTSVSLTPSWTAPRFTGTTVVWSASVVGGQSPYQYQFVLWDGAAWKVTRAWDTNPTYSWTPTTPNAAYQMAVWVRSAWNTGAKEISTSRSFAILPPVSSVEIAADVPSPKGIGTTVTFTATASGGTAPIQYQWSLYNSGWTVVQSWSTNNAFVWTPSVANPSYVIKVEARSGWNTQGYESLETLSYTIRPVVTSATLTPNLSSPRSSGTAIRWTASASGGFGPPYQYRWTVWNGTVWTTMTDWSTTSFFDWTPTTPNANYKVGVAVRGTWNTGPAEFTVSQPFVIQ